MPAPIAWGLSNSGWQYLGFSYGLAPVCDRVWAFAPGTDIGCGVNFAWPYPTYFDVPELGTDAGSLQLGVICVYFGDSAKPSIDEFIAANGEDGQDIADSSIAQ